SSHLVYSDEILLLHRAELSSSPGRLGNRLHLPGFYPPSSMNNRVIRGFTAPRLANNRLTSSRISTPRLVNNRFTSSRIYQFHLSMKGQFISRLHQDTP